MIGFSGIDLVCDLSSYGIRRNIRDEFTYVRQAFQSRIDVSGNIFLLLFHGVGPFRIKCRIHYRGMHALLRLFCMERQLLTSCDIENYASCDVRLGYFVFMNDFPVGLYGNPSLATATVVAVYRS